VSGDRTAKGRFAPGNRAASVSKAKRPAGSDDIVAFSGFVSTQESSADLQGSKKWTTYARAFDRPPVAIRALIQHALLSGAKWSLHENESGSKDAIRGMEVVEQGLLEARLPTPWPEIVAKAAMSWFNGSSLHATSMGRRKDGLVTYTDIAHRPMHTIDGWLSPTNSAPWEYARQRTRDGRTAEIPLNECLYIVEKMLSDDPFGVGTLRLVVERIRRAGKYEQLEGSELFSSMAGTPIYRAPFEEINAEVANEENPTAARDRKLSPIREAVANRIKSPEKQMYVGLSSATYTGNDPNTISGIKKWDIEILKGDLQGLAEIRKVISDLDLDIARIMGVEFVLVGGNDSAGSYGMHESKVSMFTATMQALLSRVADRATQQLARRLVAANGLDPDIACPTLVPEKITMNAVLDVVAALEGITRAGLRPDDPATNIIRERMELPPAPDGAADLMLPRGRGLPVAEDVPDAPAEDVLEDAPPVDTTKRRRTR
jgi:hypothetical protein